MNTNITKESNIAARRAARRRKIRRRNSRRRIALFVMILMMTIANFAAFGSLAVDRMSDDVHAQEYQEITVCDGDTLWDIANMYMPADMDQREAVHVIKKANHIHDCSIASGQTIKVPVYDETMEM